MVRPTRAFERQTVDAESDQGLYWGNRQVTMRPLYSSSEDLSVSDARDAITASVVSWQKAGDGCSDLLFFEGGEPSGSATNLTSGTPDGENRIVWREDRWTVSSGRALAVTSIEFDLNTGEIFDADIDVNGVNFVWTIVTGANPGTDEEGRPFQDLQNTMAHEFGHVLGFAHSLVFEATMWGGSEDGETNKRSLDNDDVLAVCTVYPEGRLGPGESGSVTAGACGVGSHPIGLWWLLVVVVFFLRLRSTTGPAASA